MVATAPATATATVPGSLGGSGSLDGSGGVRARVDRSASDLLLLRRSAFNCLALVVCRTQEKEKLYHSILFKEDYKVR